MIRKCSTLGAGAVLLLLMAPLALGQTADDSPVAAPGASADGALPNIATLRADLDSLSAELQALRGALQVSGAAGYAEAGGASAIERMDRMEARIRQLTGTIEETRNRVEQTIRDSAALLDDLEFRLCQLEDGCDLGAFMSADGDFLASPPVPAPADGADRPAAQASSAAERADFEVAIQLAESGAHEEAAEAFAAFARDHANGPLFAEARFREGQELLTLGDQRGASLAWTEVFAADAQGPFAPVALFGVAEILASQGQDQPACFFLGETLHRYAGNPDIADAAGLYARLDCDTLLEAESDDAGTAAPVR